MSGNSHWNPAGEPDLSGSGTESGWAGYVRARGRTCPASFSGTRLWGRISPTWQEILVEDWFRLFALHQLSQASPLSCNGEERERMTLLKNLLEIIPSIGQKWLCSRSMMMLSLSTIYLLLMQHKSFTWSQRSSVFEEINQFAKILHETEIFDRRPDMSGRMAG